MMAMSSVQGGRLVDVLIPVRAPAPWLGEALRSVVQQESRAWRLIVVMDGLSQEVHDACDDLPDGTPMQIEVLPTGSGLVRALNHGLRVSQAEFVARLDADDTCHPQRLARQLEYLNRTPECVALGTGVQLIDEHGAPCGARGGGEIGSVLRTLRWRSPIAHPSVMMRRAEVLSIGGYSKQARHAEDFDLWLRMASIGEIHAIPELLLNYRIHGGQVTSSAAFPIETRETIEASRLALARARGESTTAAWFRHQCWVAVNRAKGR